MHQGAHEITQPVSIVTASHVGIVSGVLPPPDTSTTAPEPCCALGCGYLVRAPRVYCPLHDDDPRGSVGHR